MALPSEGTGGAAPVRCTTSTLDIINPSGSAIQIPFPSIQALGQRGVASTNKYGKGRRLGLEKDPCSPLLPWKGEWASWKHGQNMGMGSPNKHPRGEEGPPLAVPRPDEVVWLCTI
ncbi:hypothetical protein GQX73_g9724 [Xylaria multiplex]|uniref:Uncharacterized protein n=1 Tax=Xylaria multiplex TaxID=323545 RepID=A0A7C8MMK8_9PEZI|nr:hypothetical protein GQX73_g9724 [Xylaria multiplex]